VLEIGGHLFERETRLELQLTFGETIFTPPIEPKKRASPKLNTPPSLATSQ